MLFINYCHEKHTFTNEELDNIHLFSHQAAVAISNAMLYEDEQKRREVLKIIDEAGRTVTGSLQLDEIFDNLAHQVYELSGERGKRPASPPSPWSKGTTPSCRPPIHPPRRRTSSVPIFPGSTWMKGRTAGSASSDGR